MTVGVNSWSHYITALWEIFACQLISCTIVGVYDALLWRPMSIILIFCVSPLVLCNGKRTQNALPWPFCTPFSWSVATCMLAYVSTFAKIRTHVITLTVSFPPPFLPFWVNEAHRFDIQVLTVFQVFWRVRISWLCLFPTWFPTQPTYTHTH